MNEQTVLRSGRRLERSIGNGPGPARSVIRRQFAAIIAGLRQAMMDHHFSLLRTAAELGVDAHELLQALRADRLPPSLARAACREFGLVWPGIR